VDAPGTPTILRVVTPAEEEIAPRSRAGFLPPARTDTRAEGAQATSGEAVVAIERRGQQLDRWMSMTQDMVEVSGKVQPAVQLQQSAADSVTLAIQLIADRSRGVAAAAKDAASTASIQAALAADLAVSGLDPEEDR
jgi:hypothetical protein